MAGSQTCSACRGRKVRCDGVLPVCGPCSKARRPVDCEYTTASTISAGPKGEYLKKGAACVPCRRKKKKCDAKRPYCSTCKVAGKEKDCAYDENVERTLTEALFLRTHELEQRLAVYENHISALRVSQVLPHHDQPVASTSQLSNLRPSLSTLNAGPIYNFPQAFNSLFNHIAAPSPTVDLHSISTPAIPQGLEEFRSVFAEHTRQCGCTLSTEKLQAILVGDLSGTVVHPSFTYIAQLLGCLLWQVQRRIFVFPHVEFEQLQLLWVALDDADPVTEIQIRYLLAIYFLLKKQMEDGEEQLSTAVRVALHHRLAFPVGPDDFDPLTMHDATPGQIELISTLSHLMYLDRCSALVFRVPARLDHTWDEGFKAVALFHPYIAKTNVVYLRARSLLLLVRTRDAAREWAELSASAHGGIFAPGRPAWFERYWPLLEEVSTHVTAVEAEMLRATFYGDRAHGVALKFSLVVALASKAELHWLVHRAHPESMQRSLDTVMEVVGITRSFKDNDFILLDPLLGVCWSMIARIVVHVAHRPTLAAGMSWNAALETIDASARRLGSEMPFMEESLKVISDVMRVVEVADSVSSREGR
ncbi:hypothetical protein BC628DRAFT_1352865 [Trametes gibbosa]|nr:hypothetical protein BC628DRAFT_1352865 [Trametes gibbosa]UVI59125.1 Zn(2)-Cys(6)24 [Trametes gibbosa]